MIKYILCAPFQMLTPTACNTGKDPLDHTVTQVLIVSSMVVVENCRVTEKSAAVFPLCCPESEI
jgi:hypothetical protein